MSYRYHYSILSHQASLGTGEPKPFAVIVESDRYIYATFFPLDGDPSTVTGQILQNFQSILGARVKVASAAVRGRRGVKALDVLRREFAWNITASPVSTKYALFKSIEEVADGLFHQHVERPSQASESVEVMTVHQQFTVHFDITQQALLAA
ncbi:MAG: hypothetical protein JWO97_483 [Acidobacteria bacterium]|nr:hypothetical protein [Acidobacteriota bacterium]